MPSVPAWLPGRVLYQLHSLAAAGAPATNADVDAVAPTGRGLRVLEGWLDHVAALGCGAVLLTPIAVSSTHGYDTVDPFRLDQRLGDADDFDRFVAACHERDLRLVLDGVYNHVGRQFPGFRDVLAHAAQSSYADWFHLDFSRDDGDGFSYKAFEGHRELVTLHHDAEPVLDWAVAVANHWLDRGADGWRFDAAYAIPKPFLRAVVDAARRRHPDALFFGEVIHGDYAGFTAATGLDSVTQYELHKAIWSSLNDANFFELAWALRRHAEFAGAFVPITFAGNHDVTRLATQLANPRHLAAALAVLFTVPGVPCVYYGDEFAWTGRKEHRAGGDDAIRPPLPPHPAPADEREAATLAVHEQLIALRRENPWLTASGITVDDVANQRIAYTVTAGERALHVVLTTEGDGDLPAGWTPVLRLPGVVAGAKNGTFSSGGAAR